MSKPVVVGVDGTPATEVALHWAITETARRFLPLVVVHAGDVSTYPAVGGGSVLERTRGQQVAADAVAVVQAMNRDIRVSSVVIPGNPGDVLASWSTDASMIVLGSHRRGAISTAVHGSVSATVAARAQCPVVVVPVEPGRRAPVVVGVDGSLAAKAAVEFAFDHAARQGSWVHAIHTWHRAVLPGAGDLPTQRAAHLKVVTDTLTGMRDRYPKVPVRVVRMIGRPDEILAEESMEAQLLVVGTRGHGFASGLLLGSVSQSLIRSASCPLAIVPAKDE